MADRKNKVPGRVNQPLAELEIEGRLEDLL